MAMMAGWLLGGFSIRPGLGAGAIFFPQLLKSWANSKNTPWNRLILIQPVYKYNKNLNDFWGQL